MIKVLCTKVNGETKHTNYTDISPPILVHMYIMAANQSKKKKHDKLMNYAHIHGTYGITENTFHV